MTNSAEHAEVVRRGYAPFNAADVLALHEIFDEGATWHTPGRSSVAGCPAHRPTAPSPLRTDTGCDTIW
jgi:hypothetical protein